MVSKVIRHPWTEAAARLLLVMAIYTLSRLLFVWANADLYPDAHGAHLWEMLWGGTRFDLTALLYLNSLYLLLSLLPLPVAWREHRAFRVLKDVFYILPNALGIIANMADTIYVRWNDRRTTCNVFTEFANDDNIASIVLTAMGQYWYVVLAGLLLISLLCSPLWLHSRLTRTSAPVQKGGWLYYLRESAILLVTVYFVVIGIRGGFGAYTRPITISNALQYTSTPGETAIVLNTPFSLMKSLENETYVNPHYFADDDLETIMSPLHLTSNSPEDDLTSNSPKDGPAPNNVVVLILESFSSEYIRDGYAPFLDSLLHHSVTYTHTYASGRKSIDAMPSVLSSIPMLIEPYIVTPYSTNDVMSIASCLKTKGYTTAFFHGAPNGSMGFQAYARSAGFDAYYGMDEYDGPEAFDGTWAIWDEEFLQYYARTMDALPEPFMTAVFTASSHHPYRIPARYEGQFPKGSIPMHQCIGYSDMALRRFFDYARQQPWYEHTLFVLTADHTNQLVHPLDPHRALYEIPIAFYGAGLVPELREEVVSQIDIMPSVLSYLGYDAPYIAFGEDALTQPKQHHSAVCYYHPVYELLTADDVLVLGEDNSSRAEDEAYLKAFIQQYISRMINNNLNVR